MPPSASERQRTAWSWKRLSSSCVTVSARPVSKVSNLCSQGWKVGRMATRRLAFVWNKVVSRAHGLSHRLANDGGERVVRAVAALWPGGHAIVLAAHAPSQSRRPQRPLRESSPCWNLCLVKAWMPVYQISSKLPSCCATMAVVWAEWYGCTCSRR